MLADRLRDLMIELDSGRMSERDFDKLSRTVSNFSNSGAERQLLPEGNLFPSSSGTVLASTKLKLLQEAVKSSPSDFCWCMIVCQEVTQVWPPHFYLFWRCYNSCKGVAANLKVQLIVKFFCMKCTSSALQF